MKILFIEDDIGLALTLTDRLCAEKFDVTHLVDGSGAMECLLKENYDLVLLDLMLPGKSGLDICIDIRMRLPEIPIIMLTAMSQLDDKITGLRLGADDYITKPFEPAELIARIEALLRRSKNQTQNDLSTFKFENIEIDFVHLEVRRGGELIPFAQKEFQLLKYLVINNGRSISREEILESVWGYDANITTRTIDTHIGWLRQKLEDDPKNPRFILTVFGYGYRFMK